MKFLKDFEDLFLDISIGEKGHWKPIQTGIRLSTASLLEIQDVLLKEGLPYILTSRFTQDKIENLFSTIRQRNKAPNAYEFKNYLKNVSVAQYMHESRGSNYQLDDATYLADFLEVKEAIEDPREVEEDSLDGDFFEHLESKFPTFQLSSDECENLYYFCGYVIFSFLKNSKNALCEECINDLSIKPGPYHIGGFYKIIKLKDYTGKALKYCNKKVFEQLVIPLERRFQMLSS